MSAKVGPQLAADLYPLRSWRDIPPANSALPLEELPKPPPMPETKNRLPGRRQDAAATAGETPALRKTALQTATAGGPPALQQAALQVLCGVLCAGHEDLRAGSNDWVISGAHTVSGRPMLSNDMHLPHQLPNIWYEAQLTAGDFDVEGVTLPGVPFVIVGHNRRIAWGFTNVNPQVTDLYVENINAQDQYQTPDGWKPVEHRRETIHVKGQPDVVVDVRSTRHGPIISAELPGETRQIALKATMEDPGALQSPFYFVNAAQNWDEFRAAFAQFGMPGQNVVYADVDGHIGYQTTGYVPLRKSPATGLPVAGSTDDHEWTGYIPWDEMPRVFDPPSGVLATANGRITPDDYKYFVSAEWEAPYRTERIYRVLRSEKKFAAADMLELQTDVYSDFDRLCAERLVYGVDHAKNASPRAKQAAEIMRHWDGRLTVDSAAAVIETRARTALYKALLEPKLGALTT
ncbi:MAG TPA: penicillin acylase family protein, partial [Ramlibacter sp.]|nr:penicillin acylase family protein [Ramlibacter sp.]